MSGERTRALRVALLTAWLVVPMLLGSIGCAHNVVASGPPAPCPGVDTVDFDGSGSVSALGRRATIDSYNWRMSRLASATDSVYPETAEVDEMVRELARASLVESSRPLRYEQAQNDCQHRAHVAAAHILAQREGWLVGKVLVQGHLGMAHGKIDWGWHIAPVVIASHGAERVALVLDPAVDDTRGLRIVDWIAAIHRPDAAKPARLEIAPAERWQPDERALDYCKELTAAGDALRNFAREYDARTVRARERTRVGVRVTRIEPAKQRVWFVDTAWFHYPESLRQELEDAKAGDQAITIKYRKVHIRGRRIHYLHIHAIGGVASAIPPPPTPSREELARNWRALAGVVADDVRARRDLDAVSRPGVTARPRCESGLPPFIVPRGCEACVLSVEERRQ